MRLARPAHLICPHGMVLDEGLSDEDDEAVQLYVPRPYKSIHVSHLQPEAEELARMRMEDEKRCAALTAHKCSRAVIMIQQQMELKMRKMREEEVLRQRQEAQAKLEEVARRTRFLVHAIAYSRDMRTSFGKLPPLRRQQRNSGVRMWHSREKARMQREAQARVLALKAHNYDEYIRLARTAKDDRLRTLLNKTDEIMHILGDHVKEQRSHNTQISKDLDKASKEAATGDGSATAEVAAAATAAAADELALQGIESETDSEAEAEPGERNEADRLIQRQHKYYDLVHNISEEVKQPTMTLEAGTLRSYQLSGLKFMVSLNNNRMNGILADEMGLGKTIQTVCYLAYLMEFKNNNGPHLVLAPKAVLSNWCSELEKWTPGISFVLYDGTPDERKMIRAEYIDRGIFNVILTHYDLAIRDKSMFKKITWETLVVDEGHRLKNADSKLFEILSGYAFRQRLLLTGTPVQNSLTELWALLNFLLPKVFTSSDSFDQWFAAPFKGHTEDLCCQLKEEEQLLIINRLHQVIRPFMLRRQKTEVEKELPSKTEHIIKCAMSAWQRVLYSQITENGKIMLGGAGGKARSLRNMSMHLRKACNHPFLLSEDQLEPADPEDLVRSSGKLELLDRILPKLRRMGHRVLLFSQMTRALDLVEDFLNLRGFKYLRLDGSTKTEDRGRLLEEFNRENSPYFLFMLSTRAGGLGLNLQTADTVIMFDSDWNPAADLQAEDRAHRIGQKREVLVLVLVSAGTVEEAILSKAHKKRDIDAKVIQAGMFNDKSTNEERQQALEAIMKKGASQIGGDVHSEEAVNEMLARSEEEMKVFEEMDQERRALTGVPSRPPLMTLEEVPKWVVEHEKKEQSSSSSESDAEEGHRKRRARKAACTQGYVDDLDSEFEDLVAESSDTSSKADDYELPGPERKKAERRKRLSEHIPCRVGSDVNTDDESAMELDTTKSEEHGGGSAKEAPPPKKRRGRPRKNPLPAQEEEQAFPKAAGETQAPQLEVKLLPASGTKATAPTVTASKSSAPSATASKSSAATATASKSSASTATASKSSAPTATASKSSAAKASTPPPAGDVLVLKRRGRPPKKKPSLPPPPQQLLDPASGTSVTLTEAETKKAPLPPARMWPTPVATTSAPSGPPGALPPPTATTSAPSSTPGALPTLVATSSAPSGTPQALPPPTATASAPSSTPGALPTLVATSSAPSGNPQALPPPTATATAPSGILMREQMRPLTTDKAGECDGSEEKSIEDRGTIRKGLPAGTARTGHVVDAAGEAGAEGEAGVAGLAGAAGEAVTGRGRVADSSAEMSGWPAVNTTAEVSVSKVASGEGEVAETAGAEGAQMATAAASGAGACPSSHTSHLTSASRPNPTFHQPIGLIGAIELARPPEAEPTGNDLAATTAGGATSSLAWMPTIAAPPVSDPGGPPVSDPPLAGPPVSHPPASEPQRPQEASPHPSVDTASINVGDTVGRSKDNHHSHPPYPDESLFDKDL